MMVDPRLARQQIRRENYWFYESVGAPRAKRREYSSRQCLFSDVDKFCQQDQGDNISIPTLFRASQLSVYFYVIYGGKAPTGKDDGTLPHKS